MGASFVTGASEEGGTILPLRAMSTAACALRHHIVPVENSLGDGRPMPTTQRVRSTLATLTALTGPGGTTFGVGLAKYRKSQQNGKWHDPCSIRLRRCPAAFASSSPYFVQGHRLFFLAWGSAQHFQTNGAESGLLAALLQSSRSSLFVSFAVREEASSKTSFVARLSSFAPFLSSLLLER